MDAWVGVSGETEQDAYDWGMSEEDFGRWVNYGRGTDGLGNKYFLPVFQQVSNSDTGFVHTAFVRCSN